MGRDEQRALAAPDRLLEPLDRAEVEMVRRLVEEQEVGVGDEESGERGARLLAAGELLRRPRALGLAEAKARERLVHALVERPAVEGREAGRQLLVARRRSAVALLERAHLGFDRLHADRPAANRGPQVRCRRKRLVEVRLLGEQPNPEIAAPLDLAGVRRLEPGQDAQEGGLAAAGWAEQGEELPVLDLQVEAVERAHAAREDLCQTADLEVGHQPLIPP